MGKILKKRISSERFQDKSKNDQRARGRVMERDGEIDQFQLLEERVDYLPVEDRLEGTAAAVAVGIANGTDMVRVHDVRQIVRVCRMSDAIIRRRQSGD